MSTLLQVGACEDRALRVKHHTHCQTYPNGRLPKSPSHTSSSCCVHKGVQALQQAAKGKKASDAPSFSFFLPLSTIVDHS